MAAGRRDPFAMDRNLGVVTHRSAVGPSATSGDVRFCAAVDGRADIKAQPTPVHALVLTRLTFALRLVF
jgi:hypothetical protein